MAAFRSGKELPGPQQTALRNIGHNTLLGSRGAKHLVLRQQPLAEAVGPVPRRGCSSSAGGLWLPAPVTNRSQTLTGFPVFPGDYTQVPESSKRGRFLFSATWISTEES